MPSAPGYRHRQQFEFARWLKANPALADADLASLRPIVKRWHASALPVIGTKPFEETWLDFVEGWDKVKFPAGQEPIALIYRQAISQVPPDCAAEYEQPMLQSLVALCRELQSVAGDAPFFLAGRPAAQLLGVEHYQVVRWLRLLVIDGVLELVKRGSPRRASRYRYRGY